MGDKIDRALKKVKLWQEECKLVVMFIGSVTAVSVFFSRLFRGEVGGGVMKDMRPDMGPEGNEVIPELVNHIHKTDWILWGSVVMFVVFLVVGMILFVKVMKKHMNGIAK